MVASDEQRILASVCTRLWMLARQRKLPPRILQWLFIRVHLSLADNSFALNPDIRSHVTRQTPPTFLLQIMRCMTRGPV